MWSRSDLKQKGKAAFKASYWRYVIVSAILTALMATSAKSSSNGGSNDSGQDIFNELSSGELAAVLAIVSVAIIGGLLIALAIKIFVTNPIKVGAYRFFIKGSNGENPELNTLISSYKDGNFGKIFLTMFLNDLFLALWTMLFIIPGIIKAYSYRMVPYILAENPDMKPTEVITKSREMMNGHKMNAFLLDLSFIGWFILTIITLGIVGVFYVNPYKNATDAELYKAIKEN